MEAIGMKCTREEYESIREFVGELTVPDSKDFGEFNYLHINDDDGTIFMHYKHNGIKNYETFDKDVFLKAFVIEPNITVGIAEQARFIDVIKSMEKRKEDSFWGLNTDITKETIKSLHPTIKKEKKATMLETAINLLKDLDTEYGYDIDYEGNKYGDGTFTITITGNTK